TSLNMDPARVIVHLAPPAEVQRVEQLRKQIAELDKEIQKLRQKAKAKEGPEADLQAQIDAKTQQLQQLKKLQPLAVPRAVVVQEGGHADTLYKTFQDAPVFLRGDPLRPGAVVPRGFPRVLGGGPHRPIAQGSGRLELAHWLTRPAHPLTARVMVNRI